ncbi:MAG: CDGSH iron-sulfur domain-containing protein [Methanomassiliicoccales archaeon]|nr:MAG: CDGSH iron-sulfur domain-containing protein [Methanomassiliicoccales archaeon]
MRPSKKGKVVISKNGPYLVSGGLPLSKQIILVGRDNEPESWMEGDRYPAQEEYSLCRCGGSKEKPFCDGSHIKKRFYGKETASALPYLDVAIRVTGEDLVLTDAEDLCAGARFCHKGRGTWEIVESSEDDEEKGIAIDSAMKCPSGRLVIWDKRSNEPLEPDYEPSIGIIEDPQEEVSGPIWVRGRVRIFSEEGRRYEVRNRVTLCRCGASRNKPFCDGGHRRIRFNDGDRSLG